VAKNRKKGKKPIKSGKKGKKTFKKEKKGKKVKKGGAPNHDRNYGPIPFV